MFRGQQRPAQWKVNSPAFQRSITLAFSFKTPDTFVPPFKTLDTFVSPNAKTMTPDTFVFLILV